MNVKISELPSHIGTLDENLLIPVTDLDDLSGDASGTTKHINARQIIDEAGSSIDQDQIITDATDAALLAIDRNQIIADAVSQAVAQFPASPEDATSILEVASREGLVTNGSGLLGSAKWFTGMVFDGADTNGFPGAFRFTGRNGSATFDELIPLSPRQRYEFSLSIKREGSGNNRQYLGFIPYDIDQNRIEPWHVFRSPGTKATLTQPLSPGDSVVHVNDASLFSTESSTVFRYFAIFGYKNSRGFLYPDYTRYTQKDAYDPSTGIDLGNNTITLKAPLAASLGNPEDGGGVWPVGTEVASTRWNSNVKWSLANNASPPLDEWTELSTILEGTDIPTEWNNSKLANGQAFARLSALMNFSTTELTDSVLFTGVSIRERPA